jgi:hypothetical protein
VPGRRNYFAERAQHAAIAPDQQRALHALLIAQLPAFDRALIGQAAILNYLHQFGLRRRNGGPLTWRMILRWRRDEGFPVLRGRYTPHRHRSPALSTTHALTAWTLSRFSSDEHHLFRVDVSHGSSEGGSRPAFLVPRNAAVASARGIGKGRWVRPFAVIRLPDGNTDRTRTPL